MSPFEVFKELAKEAKRIRIEPSEQNGLAYQRAVCSYVTSHDGKEMRVLNSPAYCYFYRVLRKHQIEVMAKTEKSEYRLCNFIIDLDELTWTRYHGQDNLSKTDSLPLTDHELMLLAPLNPNN